MPENDGSSPTVLKHLDGPERSTGQGLGEFFELGFIAPTGPATARRILPRSITMRRRLTESTQCHTHRLPPRWRRARTRIPSRRHGPQTLEHATERIEQTPPWPMRPRTRPARRASAVTSLPGTSYDRGRPWLVAGPYHPCGAPSEKTRRTFGGSMPFPGRRYDFGKAVSLAGQESQS
jgi:hypothetical protein